MKVLVYFEPTTNKHFEGARLRKSIKGALELSNISHTRNLLDDFDVAHFISPDDETHLNNIEENVPVIVSALYCEDDENARYLEMKKRKDGTTKWFLNKKGIKFLNKANIVLTPTAEARDFLINCGVTSEIVVSLPGINLARFNFSREDEKSVFHRYFGINDTKKCVLAIGDCANNYVGFNTFINCAKSSPDTNFFYISPLNSLNFKRHYKKAASKCPKNARVLNVMTDDLYRSALMNANLIFYPGTNPVGIISLFDAMAAKCQIIAREGAVVPGFLNNGENAYVAENDDEMISLVGKYIKGEVQPTFDKAYEEVIEHKLENFGEELIKIYTKQIALK